MKILLSLSPALTDASAAVAVSMQAVHMSVFVSVFWICNILVELIQLNIYYCLNNLIVCFVFDNY